MFTNQHERRELPFLCRRKERLQEVEARNLAATLSRNSNEPMSAYLCRYCSAWHVGHPRKITDEPPVNQAVPKSQKEATEELTKLKADSLSLKHAIERFDRDQSKQGWMKTKLGLEAQLRVNRERIAYLKAWLTRQTGHDGPKALNVTTLRDKGFPDSAAAFYEVGMNRFRDADDGAGKRLFGLLFALVNVDPDNPHQIRSLQESFQNRVELWHINRVERGVQEARDES